MSLLTAYCTHSSVPQPFASLEKMTPDVALVGVWAVRSTMSLHCLIVFCFPVSILGWIKQISRTDSSSPGFKSWGPGELPFPMIAGGAPAPGGAQTTSCWLPMEYLVTPKPHCCLLLCLSVSRCPSAIGLSFPISYNVYSLFCPGYWFSVCLSVSLPYSAILILPLPLYKLQNIILMRWRGKSWNN